MPLITLDQPLYAIAKAIQWNWQETYGEDHFVIMLGGLHTEMAGLKVIGDWLEDSGWVEALVQAKVASAGTANSFVNVFHITRTRRAHQVTASSLHILLKRAYTHYMESVDPGVQPQTFEEWCEIGQKEIPHFKFWYTTLQLKLLVWIYVKSLRTANFSLYFDCLTKLAPCFFCLDHTNYARWLPVHIRDMVNLSNTHPNITSEFHNGKFTVHKTRREFSSIALDHAHEQNNATIKSDGGAIGLTQNPEALQRWMVAGPELVRITAEFEVSMERLHQRSSNTNHHDQTKSNQVTFAQHVKSLVEVIEEMDSKDSTRDMADTAVASSVCCAEETGEKSILDLRK